MNLDDLLNQIRRWSIGFLDMLFSKFSPFTYGLRRIPFLQTMCYLHNSSWPVVCIPVVIYSVLPQLGLIHSFPIFPKISEKWFWLYIFTFTGAYIQEFIEFTLNGGTPKRWFNSQRAWIIRSLSSFTFATIEYTLTRLGISSSTFNVTSKVVDKEANSRYEKGMMEFGVESRLFYPITVAALVNVAAFEYGVVSVFKVGGLGDVFLQLVLSGFGVVNGWPVYEAMFLRSDNGKMPLKVTLRSIGLAWMVYVASHLVFLTVLMSCFF